MAKPKPKTTSPFSTDYEDKIWWEYKDYSEQQLSLLDDYLKKNAKEITSLFTQEFFPTLQAVYKFIGIKPHPVLGEEPAYLSDQSQKQASSNPLGDDADKHHAAVSAEGLEQKNVYLLFQNQKVDLYSLRILQLVLPSFPNFSAFKFCNNGFTPSQIQLLFQILTAQNCQISKLFFEWNPLKQSSSLISSLQKPLQLYSQDQQFSYFRGSSNLEFLILRSCQIDDDIVISLMKSFSENLQTRIKYIELFSNQVKGQGLKAIGDFIESYQKLEYIGLAKNGITSLELVKDIFSRIGKKQLTSEELAAYRDKEKEKEAIIAKAAKNKKKVTDDMLPVLDPIVQLPDGNFATLRNVQMKMINLSMNAITEQDAEFLEKFLGQCSEELQIVLNHNSFDPKYKDKLKKKYKKNVQI